jgi:hypothetical protein
LTDLFTRIDELIALCPPSANLHDRALVAITVAIGDGIDTKDGLIRVLVKYGFNGGHIAKVLDDRNGPFRNSDHWHVDADGQYRLRE